jgi:putative spermidine/putrescine transport system permease protein
MRLLLVGSLATPIVIPPLILAVGFLRLFSTLHVYDTYASVVCAHLVLALPYAYVVMALGFRRIDRRLEDVACRLGATRLESFLRVTVPQLRPSLVAAGFLSFLISFDEPVMALFITGTRTRTLPRQIFEMVRYDADPAVAAVSVLFIALSVIVALLLRT